MSIPIIQPKTIYILVETWIDSAHDLDPQLIICPDKITAANIGLEKALTVLSEQVRCHPNLLSSDVDAIRVDPRRNWDVNENYYESGVIWKSEPQPNGLFYAKIFTYGDHQDLPFNYHIAVYEVAVPEY